MRPVWIDDPTDLTSFELDQIWNKLVKELLDADYQRRTHMNTRTYDEGCRGPACSLSTRTRARQRKNNNPSKSMVDLDLAIQYYFPLAKAKIEEVKSNLLHQLMVKG